MKKSALLVMILVATIHALGWMYLNVAKKESPWYGSINGVSFAPYRSGQSPDTQIYPSVNQIDQDLALLAVKSIKRVRIYSALYPLDVVPKLADQYGLEVTAGAWISDKEDKNREEIESLINLVKNNKNITRVLVGNEVLLRRDLVESGKDKDDPVEARKGVEKLYAYLDEVRARIAALKLDREVPVSTADSRDVWNGCPEVDPATQKQIPGTEICKDLYQHTDYVAVHLLPYWDSKLVTEAVPYVLQQYNKIKQLYPGMPILVAEIGWPSQGGRKGDAEPSPVNQESFIRSWLAAAKENNIDYSIIEAFDQPYKRSNEGSAGPYWGIFDANRNMKLNFYAEHVENNPTWKWQLGISAVAGILLMMFFLKSFRRINTMGVLVYCTVIQATITLVVTTSFVPQKIYFTFSGIGMLAVMVAAQVGLLVVVLINSFEFTELLWRKDWDRSFKPLEDKGDRTDWPKVSIHLACYNEPADLVIQTLDQLALMDYPNFEVLVLDNNTPSDEVWKPLQAHCKKLGDRFRFFHIAPWGGFKAGALNFGVDMTDPEAQMIAVIDADYIVESNWLKSLIPYFDNKKVGFVQAPQDHREWGDDTFKTMINWEYAGFFNIGMVHRNERNAIIQHGTMTIIRKSVLQESGNWGEWCICEDTELGLRMMELGYESVYVNHVFGRGVVPDSFTAYKTQRFRWAYGAVQILRRYWKDMLPFNKSGLTAAQKFYFVSGWLPWFADALHLLFSLGSVFWGLGILLFPRYFEVPLPIFFFSVAFLFLVKLGTGYILYKSRVPCNFKQRLGALLAGVALTHVVGRAMIAGILNPVKPFLRTPKGEDKPTFWHGFLMAQEEAILWIVMWGIAIATIAFYGANIKGGLSWQQTLEMKDILYWSIMLMIQSLPYLAALILSMINVRPNKDADEKEQE